MSRVRFVQAASPPSPPFLTLPRLLGREGWGKGWGGGRAINEALQRLRRRETAPAGYFLGKGERLKAA
jgi:hypothetical protein